MARLVQSLKSACPQTLPDTDKMKLALYWLRENPIEKPTTTARLFKIEKADLVRKAWLREKNRGGRAPQLYEGGVGWNTILRPEQNQAVIQYAVD